MLRTNCRPTPDADRLSRRVMRATDPITLASIYTPGDVTGPARPQLAATPYSGPLNTSAGNPVHTPIVGVLVAVGIVLLLERRRIKLRV